MSPTNVFSCWWWFIGINTLQLFQILCSFKLNIFSEVEWNWLILPVEEGKKEVMCHSLKLGCFFVCVSCGCQVWCFDVYMPSTTHACKKTFFRCWTVDIASPYYAYDVLCLQIMCIYGGLCGYHCLAWKNGADSKRGHFAFWQDVFYQRWGHQGVQGVQMLSILYCHYYYHCYYCYQYLYYYYFFIFVIFIIVIIIIIFIIFIIIIIIIIVFVFLLSLLLSFFLLSFLLLLSLLLSLLFLLLLSLFLRTTNPTSFCLRNLKNLSDLPVKSVMESTERWPDSPELSIFCAFAFDGRENQW